MHMCIYIYIKRERERKREILICGAGARPIREQGVLKFGVFQGDHLSNTACLTHMFFETGEQYSKL